MKHKKNYTIAITGIEPTGIGKSTYGRTIARKLSPVFSPSRIVFDLEEFYSFFDYLTPGEPWVMDEAGVDLDNQQWMSLFQRMFKYITQTYRFKQIISILCVPNLSMLTINQRRLLNGTIHIFEEGRAGWSKFETAPDGSIQDVPVGIIDMDAADPTDPFEIAYEEKKHEFFGILKRNTRLEMMLWKMNPRNKGGMYSEHRTERLADMIAERGGENIENDGTLQKLLEKSDKKMVVEEEEQDENGDGQDEDDGKSEVDFTRRPGWER